MLVKLTLQLTLKLLLKSKTMTFLLPFLLLISTPSSEYDPSDYCRELTEVLSEAVKDEVITYKEAREISQGCLTTTP